MWEYLFRGWKRSEWSGLLEIGGYGLQGTAQYRPSRLLGNLCGRLSCFFEKGDSAYQGNKKTWQKVDKPIPFDVILLRTGNMVYHCGVVIGRRTMLHVMEGVNSTIEEFTSLQWKQKVEGFYRWKTIEK